MKVKDNTWKAQTSSTKVAGVYKAAKPFIKKNGLWRQEELTPEDPAIAIFQINSSRDGTVYLNIGARRTGMRMRLYSYRSSGTVIIYDVTVSASSSNTRYAIPYEGHQTARLYIDGVMDSDAGIIPFAFENNTVITAIQHLHSTKWTNKEYPITNSTVLGSVPTYLPNTVISLAQAFQNCDTFNSPNVKQWDVSKITNMNNTFFAAWAFNQDISNWNTGNVLSMVGTFRGTGNFQRDISGWNVAKVTDWTNFRLSAILSTENTPPKFR